MFLHLPKTHRVSFGIMLRMHFCLSSFKTIDIGSKDLQSWKPNMINFKIVGFLRGGCSVFKGRGCCSWGTLRIPFGKIGVHLREDKNPISKPGLFFCSHIFLGLGIYPNHRSSRWFQRFDILKLILG